MNFLENFDPETSVRERRKLDRKNYFMNRKNKKIYNERGLIATTGKDLCDCLDETCPGCHFPCPKCNSNKCGHECRSKELLCQFSHTAPSLHHHRLLTVHIHKNLIVTSFCDQNIYVIENGCMTK